jgi:hypothetical protein
MMDVLGVVLCAFVIFHLEGHAIAQTYRLGLLIAESWVQSWVIGSDVTEAPITHVSPFSV